MSLTIAGGGAAVALAGCGSSAQRRMLPDPTADHDVQVLETVLALERRAVTAYTAGIPLLTGPDRATATAFLRQELEHAGTLLSMIVGAGGRRTWRNPSYNLGHPDSPRAVIELLHEVERAEIAGYVDAIGQLSSGRLRARAAAILADHAQQITILRARLGAPPVPSAFVTGTE
jgi:hypothetical protein